MGIMGVQVWDYMYHFGLLTEGISMAFALHWAYHSMSIMTSTVRKIELHKDGKTVTVTPRIGSAWDAKITDVQKLKHEKDLV